jgi:ribosomal protein L37AE/L43A
MFCSKNGIVALTGQAFVAKFNDLPASERRRILAEVLDGDCTTPSCPQCERKMVWRENGEFWSCATFRKCGSKPIHARKTRSLQGPFNVGRSPSAQTVPAMLMVTAQVATT